MPTGYTADIADGKSVTIDDFILRCARAFGPTIHQRDEDPDNPPRRIEVDVAHYDEKIAQYAARVAEATAWTHAQAEDHAQADYADAVECWRTRSEERQETRERYEAMLAQVRAWQPPTPNHQGLKDFMIQQLEESIRFDCSGTYDDAPALQTGEEYRAAILADATRMQNAYVQYRAEEIERADKANAWIDALYAALPGRQA